MLKAFVGVASEQGLAVLHPEGDETISYVERSVRAGRNRVGFWAVIDDTEARCVNALILGGRGREALRFLNQSAKEIGRILPTEQGLELGNQIGCTTGLSVGPCGTRTAARSGCASSEVGPLKERAGLLPSGHEEG
jgi:hypothetical protein